jgi:hypothetical protein
MQNLFTTRAGIENSRATDLMESVTAKRLITWLWKSAE